ncbi:MAG TPA: recombinase RecA, partial [Methylomirabilota bacterium]|nr:recombinase RecA [Methylomirabilota bacterium]
RIGRIVRRRLPVEVLSYNPSTGEIGPRRVINWYDNGPADHFLQFVVDGGPAHRGFFAPTPNHLIFTLNGQVPAGDLHVGDSVLFGMPDYRFTSDQYQLLLGGTLGDGSLRMAGRHSAYFRVGHSSRQKEYLHWKHVLLEPFSRPIGRVGNGYGFSTLASPAVADLRRHLYDEDGQRIATSAALRQLDPRGLAVWYGDDGAYEGSHARWGKGKALICNKSLKGESRRVVCETMARLGIGEPSDDGVRFRFNAEQTARFQALIAPYLHPCVDYKLHQSLRGRFAWHPEVLSESLAGRRIMRAVPVRILQRYIKANKRRSHRFDLEIEGHHTYLVDGVVVHNSPETTPGGRALKFYASVRIDVRRQDAIKQGTDSIGVRTKAKVVKNKLAPPFREAEFDMIYGEGISKAGMILDTGVEQEVIEKSGTWYTYKNERIGQGRENAKKWLQDNPAVLADLESKIRETLGLRVPAAVK